MTTYSHAPEGYDCPFCQLAQRRDTNRSSQADVVYRDDLVMAFMAAGGWPNNLGHVLIVPTSHYENIYDLPPELGTPIQSLAQRIAFAMKATYSCGGVSTRQHNEPDGNQDVWHYHVHVFPRYKDDGLYGTKRIAVASEVRATYAAKLKAYLQDDQALK